MTIAQHGAPTTQAGPGPGPLGAGGPSAPPQGFGWQPAPPPPVKRGKGLTAAVIASIVLAAAALTVGVIALVRPAPAPPVASPTTSSARPANTTEANRAFCSDIAPLMTESNKSAQAFNHSGKVNTPEWKPGAQTFVTDTKGWLPRMQAVIDTHGDADPYLLRSIQRFVDDRRDLVADLEAGNGLEWMPYDQTSWDDSLVAGSGPLDVCWNLGVKW